MDACGQQKQRRRLLFQYLGLVISGLMFYGIFSRIPMAEVWESVTHANPWMLLAAVLFVVTNLLVRGYRWAMLFPAECGVNGRTALPPIIIGLAINGVMPGKIGEVARIGLGVRKFQTGLALTADRWAPPG